MGISPIEQLKRRVFSKSGEGKETELTSIMELIRSFSCLSRITGREFEVLNPEGELIYIIRERPMAAKQLNTLLKELSVLKVLDDKKEAAKWGGKKHSGLNRPRRR